MAAAKAGRGQDLVLVNPLSSLLAYGNAPSATVSWHILLTGVQTSPLALVADFFEAAAVGCYAWGLRRLSARGRQWSGWNTAAFVAGVVLVWIAVGSGMAAYDNVNVTVHVFQHVFLMMVAPPLIALGKPITLAMQAARRPNQVRIVKVVNSRALGVLTFSPLTWLLYYGTMYAFFLTGIYAYSVSHPLFHDATHLEFLLVGYLYWQPVVGLDPSRRRTSLPVRFAALFLGMSWEGFVAVSMLLMVNPISPVNTVAQTHTAGEVFWILSAAASGFPMALVGYRWFAQTGREADKEDRRVEADAVEAGARAAALGIGGIKEGWTVPSWRLAQLEADARAASRAARGAANASRAGVAPSVQAISQDNLRTDGASVESASPGTNRSPHAGPVGQ